MNGSSSQKHSVHVPIGTPSGVQHTPEDLLSLLKLADAITQEDALALCGRRFGHDALDLGVGHGDDHHRREDVVETTDDVALNDLGHDIGDERLLLDLWVLFSII